MTDFTAGAESVDGVSFGRISRPLPRATSPVTWSVCVREALSGVDRYVKNVTVHGPETLSAAPLVCGEAYSCTITVNGSAFDGRARIKVVQVQSSCGEEGLVMSPTVHQSSQDTFTITDVALLSPGWHTLCWWEAQRRNNLQYPYVLSSANLSEGSLGENLDSASAIYFGSLFVVSSSRERGRRTDSHCTLGLRCVLEVTESMLNVRATGSSSAAALSAALAFPWLPSSSLPLAEVQSCLLLPFRLVSSPFSAV